MKTCTKCGVAKGLECFARNANSRDGLQWYCRDCASKINREYREKYNSDVASKWGRSGRAEYMKARGFPKIAELPMEAQKKKRERLRTRAKSLRDSASKNYVRNRLASDIGVPDRLIPDDLVELAAINLKIKRLLRQRKQT